MDTGNYSTITLMQVVASVKAQLRIEVSDDDIYLEKLANEGVRHLDALSCFVKSMCTLDICDGRAQLPNGFHRLIACRTGCGSNMSDQIYFDTPYINNCSPDTTTNIQISLNPYYRLFDFSNTFQIVDGFIHFNSETTAETITVAYWGLNVDADGMNVVYERYERALVAYVCWKYVLSDLKSYTIYQADSYKDEWKQQKRWIKSNDVLQQFQIEKRQMAETVNALIVDKNWSI